MHPIKLKQDLRVFWKLMNPRDYQIIMRTLLQEKETIHHSITIWFTHLFLCQRGFRELSSWDMCAIIECTKTQNWPNLTREGHRIFLGDAQDGQNSAGFSVHRHFAGSHGVFQSRERTVAVNSDWQGNQFCDTPHPLCLNKRKRMAMRTGGKVIIHPDSKYAMGIAQALFFR